MALDRRDDVVVTAARTVGGTAPGGASDAQVFSDRGGVGAIVGQLRFVHRRQLVAYCGNSATIETVESSESWKKQQEMIALCGLHWVLLESTGVTRERDN